MNKTIEFLADKVHNGKRADVYLSENINYLTRSQLKKMIEKGNLIINEKIVKSPAAKIKYKDKIKFFVIFSEKTKLKPKNIKLDIVYEDRDILLINKPKGMVVHPGAGNYDNTLANALAFKYKDNLSNISGKLRPGIVHRIDKETSGLLVVAKNNFSHSLLSKQFNEHSIKRKYKCLIWGVIRPFNGQIKTFISRSKKNRQLMTVSDFNGKSAVTNYKTVKVFSPKNIPKVSLVECELETGRTHQIRVHFKYKGASILGDTQYGEKKLKFKKINQKFLDSVINLKGQALHAETLEFLHPTKNKWVKFKTNVPTDFKKLLVLLNNLSS